jgi:hypothetical protein
MEKKVTKITHEQLLTILMSIEKPTFTHIVTETSVRMNKGKTKEGTKEENPYHNKVTKLKSGNYLIGIDYESRVNNNDTKEGGEGTFEVSENKVGTHISKCLLFNEKTNKHYLFHERFDEIKPKTEYLFEGNTIDEVLFDKWVSESSNYDNQPQERKVKVLSVTTTNIKEISLNGEKYEVE